MYAYLFVSLYVGDCRHILYSCMHVECMYVFVSAVLVYLYEYAYMDVMYRYVCMDVQCIYIHIYNICMFAGRPM